jgi:hypothetical protein
MAGNQTFSLTLDLPSLKNATDQVKSQINFAASKALNATALNVQTAVREEMGRDFKIRRKPFARQSVKVMKFAKKTDLVATVAIAAPGDRDVWSQHEDGGIKQSKTGGSVAIPTKEFNPSDRVIPDSKRPKALKNSFVGKPGRNGVKILYTVRGRGKNKTNLAAFLLVKRVTIKPVHFFAKAAEPTAKKVWEANFKTALEKAVATAL